MTGTFFILLVSGLLVCFTMQAADVQEMKDRLAELENLVQQAGLGGAQPPVQPPTPRCVYVTKKLRSFDGKSRDVTNWVLEARGVLHDTGHTGKEAATFLKIHLEGAAEKELRILSPLEREDPEKILNLLEKQFGEKEKASKIVSDFHSRNQNKRESLMEYSHVLLELICRACKLDANLED